MLLCLIIFFLACGFLLCKTLSLKQEFSKEFSNLSNQDNRVSISFILLPKEYRQKDIRTITFDNCSEEDCIFVQNFLKDLTFDVDNLLFFVSNYNLTEKDSTPYYWIQLSKENGEQIQVRGEKGTVCIVSCFDSNGHETRRAIFNVDLKSFNLLRNAVGLPDYVENNTVNTTQRYN